MVEKKLKYSDVIKIINKEIDFHTGGEEMKSMRESITDDQIVEVLERLKRKL